MSMKLKIFVDNFGITDAGGILMKKFTEKEKDKIAEAVKKTGEKYGLPSRPKDSKKKINRKV